MIDASIITVLGIGPLETLVNRFMPDLFSERIYYTSKKIFTLLGASV